MLHPHLTHQLAADRQRDLIARADHARTAAPGRTRRRRALLAAALPVALAAVALPSAAEAGTVQSLSDGTLLYDDKSGQERNDVTLRFVNGKIVISDTAGASSLTDRCRVFNGDLECAPVPSVRLILGPGDDRVEYRLPQAGLVQMGTGNDTVVAGTRETAGQAIQPVDYRGETGRDTINYSASSSGVAVDMADGQANDGRPGDRENIAGDFELLFGSIFRDTLFGTPAPDVIFGGAERDLVAGGAGNDTFFSAVKDGADDYQGGPGTDTIEYAGRTQPLSVTLDNIANDGETDGRLTLEGDNVASNVENVVGGFGADTLRSFGAFSRLDGRAGVDTLDGGDGPDTLIGGPGRDDLQAGGGSDVVDARDGEPDFVDCGTAADTISRDASEGIIRGCEAVGVGVLRLTPKALRGAAGEQVQVGLSWRHPQSWKRLRSVALRITDGALSVGQVAISPRGRTMTADGAIELVRSASRLARRGRTASARLVLRVDPSLAGRRLRLEVEATDVRGRRQLERNAGTLRVAE